MLIGGFCGRGDLLIVIQNATITETAVDNSEPGLVVVGRLVDMIEVESICMAPHRRLGPRHRLAASCFPGPCDAFAAHASRPLPNFSPHVPHSLISVCPVCLWTQVAFSRASEAMTPDLAGVSVVLEGCSAADLPHLTVTCVPPACTLAPRSRPPPHLLSHKGHGRWALATAPAPSPKSIPLTLSTLAL